MSSRLAAVGPLLAVFLSCGCGARNIPPPAIPGLVTIADVKRCSALAVGENEIWALRYSPSDWFEAKYDLVRIDLDSNEATVKPLDVYGAYFGVAGAGLEFSSKTLWAMTEFSREDRPAIWKIDPGTGTIVAEVAHSPFGLSRAAVGEGAVWVAVSDSESTCELLRIDPETAKVVETTRLHSMVLDVAVTDGAVWALHADKTLSRIDSVTNQVLGTIRLPGAYTKIFATQDAVWLTTRSLSLFAAFLSSSGQGEEPRDGATLARLDPSANEIVATIPLGREDEQVIVEDTFVDGNRIWVSLLTVPPKDSSDPAYRFWLTEVDATTNKILRTLHVGRIGDPSARIAIADSDILVCGSTIWRIPLDALAAASRTNAGLDSHGSEGRKEQ